MNLDVNDKHIVFSAKTLHELIIELDLDSTMQIAAAVNDTVIKKACWNDFELKENDRVLIITPAQGG